jgi:hypothetical protein
MSCKEADNGHKLEGHELYLEFHCDAIILVLTRVPQRSVGIPLGLLRPNKLE